MPCYDPRSEESRVIVKTVERIVERTVNDPQDLAEIKKLKVSVSRLADSSDLATRLLCAVLDQMSQDELESVSQIKGLTDWYSEHKSFDEKRKST